MTTTAIVSRLSLVASFALAACGGSPSAQRTVLASGRVGPQGGTVQSATARLDIPAGALRSEVEIHLLETEPHHGVARVELEPRGLALAGRGHLSVRMPAGVGPLKMVGMENEVEHALEAEHENQTEHAREAEIEHLAEIELRHQNVCDPACGTGFECDDGVCKAHVEDPNAPPPSGNCPAGQELDVSDGTCKPHGGGKR